MAHDVFISYSSKDKPTADAVCARLEANGLRCWIAPRDILPGADWSESIIDAINGSRAVVLIYSSNANDSPQIRREVERAVAKRIAVVPLRIEDVPMSKSLEYFISTPHWLDAMTPPLERHLDYLAETLKRLVRPEAPLPKKVDPDPIKPQPAISPRTMMIAAGAVAALIVVAVVAIVFVLRMSSSSGGAGAPFTSGSPSGRASVDAGLTGSWSARAVVNGVPLELGMTLSNDGQAIVTSTLRDHGRYEAGGGRWTMTNAAGQTMRGTYSFTSDRTMSFAGPLGTATWTRDGTSSVDPYGRLVGTWSLSGTAPDGLPATTTFAFRSAGSYQFAATSEDALTVQASDGRWHAVSSRTGKVTDGTYQVMTPTTFSFTGPLGSTVWTRRR